MLPTNEKSNIWLRNNQLEINSSASKKINPKHLYFLSDEKPKGDDYILHSSKEVGKVLSCSEHHIIALFPVSGEVKCQKYNCKKIIACTDSSLFKNISRPLGVTQNLPQPSQDFLELYIKAYNEGKPIEWVDVEYEEELECKTCPQIKIFKAPCYKSCLKQILKVNSQNQITIKTIKDSYTREEVIELLHKRMRYSFGLDYDKSTTDKWISENL